MQIKQRANKFQLLRYKGFHKEKKRPETEVIGSIATHATSIPADLAAKLKPDEVEQLEKFLKDREHNRTIMLSDMNLRDLPRLLADAQAALERGTPLSDADQVYEAMKSLRKAMRKSGYTPKKIEPKSEKDARQMTIE